MKITAAATLFTGTTFTEIKEWADLVGLQLPSKTAYYKIQADLLIPVVDTANGEMQDALLAELRERTAAGDNIDVAGDGRLVFGIGMPIAIHLTTECDGSCLL